MQTLKPSNSEMNSLGLIKPKNYVYLLFPGANLIIINSSWFFLSSEKSCSYFVQIWNHTKTKKIMLNMHPKLNVIVKKKILIDAMTLNKNVAYKKWQMAYCCVYQGTPWVLGLLYKKKI